MTQKGIPTTKVLAADALGLDLGMLGSVMPSEVMCARERRAAMIAKETTGRVWSYGDALKHVQATQFFFKFLNFIF